MRKLTLYSALSIDGFIAATDGSIAWLHQERYALAGVDFGYQNFYDSIDTTLQGNKTYQQVRSFDVPFPYVGKKNYIFSRSRQPAAEHVEFVQEDPAAFVRRLKQTDGEGIWLVGGGQLNGLLLRAGLIDELYLTIIPAVIGDGISLFGGLEMPVQNFALLAREDFPNGFVNLRYGQQ